MRYTELFNSNKVNGNRFECHRTVINPKIRGNQYVLPQMVQESMEKLGVSDAQLKNFFNNL